MTTSIILIFVIIEIMQEKCIPKLNYTSVEEMSKKYIYEYKEENRNRTYIYGYENDNPTNIGLTYLRNMIVRRKWY